MERDRRGIPSENKLPSIAKEHPVQVFEEINAGMIRGTVPCEARHQ
jgi:hypothetical protein